MPETLEKTACGKPGCQLLVTGICPEGHMPVASCPNYGSPTTDDLDDEDDEQEAGNPGDATDSGLLSLPAGEALTPEEVERFLRWRRATFVTIVGDHKSGKTTLICSLYDRFLRGPFSGLSFAGSRSLVALEKRSHPSRVDSGRSEPETPHTSIADELRYFHFALATTGNAAQRTDLLISDRAGELYRKARSSSEVVASLTEVARGDRVVMLLDGGRTVEAAERAGAIQAVRQTLRALLDNGALGPVSRVRVVTTKLDLIVGSDERELILKHLSDFRERLAADFAGRLRELAFSEVAARDPSGRFEAGHGIAGLLQDWTETDRPQPAARNAPLPLLSEFDRLLVRTSFGGGQ